MHPASRHYMTQQFARYGASMGPGTVLEVGAASRAGSYRPIWEAGGWQYLGCDLAEGPNVDVVLDDPWRYPFADGLFDAVISGQMLEHNQFFWLSFLEMARVLRMGGLMVHIAPSRGYEHRAPQDCWRFYRDGMFALADWAGLECVEATTDWAPEHLDRFRERWPRRLSEAKATMRREGTAWGDTVGVFRKTRETAASEGAALVRAYADRLAEAAPSKPDIAAE